MTHLNPPDAAALDEVKNELDFVAAAMGFEPNSMKIMAHRPNILRGFLALMGAIIGPDAVLDPGLRQMIAYIASSAAGCRYCQAHTAHGAYLMHQDTELGELSIGMLADLIVVDQDIFAIPSQDISETKVLLTLVGGEVVFEREEAGTNG